MFQLRQLHLKDASSAASPSPSEMSSTSGARGSNDSGFGSDKEEMMESDGEVEEAQQTEQQQQPQQGHQEQHQQYSQSIRHPCADHFTSYPQLMKRAQLIPMQHHTFCRFYYSNGEHVFLKCIYNQYRYF